MPRVISMKVWRIWVAATMNDYGEIGKPRLGFNQRQAERRVVDYIDAG